jgi:hypothetical protein
MIRFTEHVARDPKLCFCNSGLPRHELIDARGIFCTFVCDACEDRRMKEFDVSIFRVDTYPQDEPIEED